jgi:hypothetical protein
VKKFIVVILSLLYIATFSGATMHLHYCMGKMIDWKLTGDATAEKCPKCGMNKASDKGCCKDEHKQLKIDDQKLIDANGSLVHLTSVAVITSWFELSFAYFPSKTEEHTRTNAPFQAQGVPLYIYNCVFRI